MKCLEMRAHRHANRGNGICNAMAKMAYRMQHGLILTWESLSHTHMRGRWMKMKCLEMRAHGHANRGNGIRNAMAWKWYANMPMGFQQQNEGQNSPEMRRKYARCMEFLPKCEIRHPKWLTAIQSMHNMDMEHEDRSKKALRQSFLQFMTWPISKQRWG